MATKSRSERAVSIYYLTMSPAKNAKRTSKNTRKIRSAAPVRGDKQRARQSAKRKSDRTCFVLMPFKEPFDTYFTAIFQPAVEAAGLMPLRGDSIFRPSPIMADIWQMIQDAQLLIAEMTEKNANVFYELGLAHAIGKPVILIAETINDVPFDLQALRVILYDKNNPEWGRKLRASITRYIRQTLAETASAVPSMFRKAVKSQAPHEPELSARVAALERRLAGMRSSPMRIIPSADEIRQMSVDEMEDAIQHAGSRTEVVDFIAHVLRYRGPHLSDVMEMILEANYPTSEVRRILQDAAAYPV
jgi:hypothetical protein